MDDQATDTSVHTMKDLGMTRRTYIACVGKNGRSFTYSAAHMQESIVHEATRQLAPETGLFHHDVVSLIQLAKGKKMAHGGKQ